MKLTYFPGRGRAEISRLILAQGGAEYEDKRIGFAEWGELKPSKVIKISPFIYQRFFILMSLKQLENLLLLFFLFAFKKRFVGKYQSWKLMVLCWLSQ